MKTATYEFVTPSTAHQWLAKLAPGQRPLVREHVQKLVRSMQRGTWRDTSAGIGFDVNGNLMNGQHRLHALIAANVTLEFLVVRGLPVNSIDVEDQGRARTRGEALHSLGMKNWNSAAAIAVILIRLKFNLTFDRTVLVDRTGIDNAEVKAFADLNFATLEWAAVQAKRYSTIPTSTYGAALWLAHHVDPVKAQLFADAVATGLNLSERSPVLALRKKCEFNSRARGTQKLELNRTSNLLPVIVRAFEAFADGEGLSKLMTIPGHFYPKGINLVTFWDDK